MTIKPSRNPYGYRNLLTYKKADELQSLCAELAVLFPKEKTCIALADQMNRSARSTKQNITEGWKRNSTKEYYEFLGYALASNAELEEDFTDIYKGHYRELIGLKGVMGERGIRSGKGEEGEGGVMGERGNEPGPSHSTSSAPSTHLTFSTHEISLTGKFHFHLDIESIKFYPLDTSLPPVVQMKLRAKELNLLIENLQKSLVEKMTSENTLPTAERIRIRDQDEKDGDRWIAEQRKKIGERELRGERGEEGEALIHKS